MSRVIFTNSALSDIKRIYKHVAESNKEAAKYAIRLIRSKIDILALQPQIGRPIDYKGCIMRQLIIDAPHGGYVALYGYAGETVQILAIRHQKESGFFS